MKEPTLPDFHRSTAVVTTLVTFAIVYLNLRTWAGWPLDIHSKDFRQIDLDFLIADLLVGMLLWLLAYVLCEFFESSRANHGRIDPELIMARFGRQICEHYLAAKYKNPVVILQISDLEAGNSKIHFRVEDGTRYSGIGGLSLHQIRTSGAIPCIVQISGQDPFWLSANLRKS